MDNTTETQVTTKPVHEKLDITVIIPISSVADEKFSEYLDLALSSIDNNEYKPTKVIISRCNCTEVVDFLKTFDLSKYDLDIAIVENPIGKSFQTQINYNAKEVVKTTYFTFLEFDDEFSINWFKNVKLYTESYPEIKMFIPIISDVDDKQAFFGFTNEAAWAYNFSDELGMINNEVLLEYPNINPDGMVVRTDAFNDCGGLKNTIKLSFNYEFLLRFTRNGDKIMVIPKIGYKHVNMRPGSLFWDYKYSPAIDVAIKPDEAIFWMETAKKEYFFNEDRNITYVENTVSEAA